MKSKLILVEQDNKASRGVARVAETWYTLVSFKETARARELLQADAGVAVLMVSHDLGERGMALLEEAREVRPDVRRVMLAGIDDLGPTIHGLHSGAVQAVVHKPVTGRELIQAIHPDAIRSGPLRPTGTDDRRGGGTGVR